MIFDFGWGERMRMKLSFALGDGPYPAGSFKIQRGIEESFFSFQRGMSWSEEDFWFHSLICRSAVTRGICKTRAVATIIRSAGSP